MTENNGTNKTTRTMDEIGINNYFEGLVDSIVSNWIEEGSETDEEELRGQIGAMLYLTSAYDLKTLIGKLFDVLDSECEYDEEIGLVEE